MTVKELMDFLSKQNPEAKVTITKTEFFDGEDDYAEPWDEDVVEELKEYNLSVDVLHDGTVDIRFL